MSLSGCISAFGAMFWRLARCIILCISIVSVAAQAAWQSDTQNIMGTQVSVTAWHESDVNANEAIAAVMAEMRRIDQSLSPYIESSELSRVNRLAVAAPVKVSRELAFLVDKSLYYSGVSKGAFDITFGSVGRYYDYREGRQPSAAQREKLLAAIDYRHVQLDRKKRTLFFQHPHVYIDLGGIAKGYAVDRAADILLAAGVRHATVSAGGDSRVLGDKRGRPWLIGIKNPRQAPGETDTLIRMPLSDVAVSTSGDYERFFIDKDSGERVHHILNPATGTSAGDVVSVTILGERGVDTDPLSTTVFVLGVKAGLALVNRTAGFDCVIIDRFGKAHYSDGLIEPSVN